jgi:hypothetical protein
MMQKKNIQNNLKNCLIKFKIYINKIILENKFKNNKSQI